MIDKKFVCQNIPEQPVKKVLIAILSKMADSQPVHKQRLTDTRLSTVEAFDPNLLLKYQMKAQISLHNCAG